MILLDFLIMEIDMKILAINTSASFAEVCINDDGKIFKNKVESPYSENIMQSVQKTLIDASTEIKDIDCFGVVNGPGSFTGIRIGMSVIKGFLCGANKKCVSINSFELVSYNINDKDFIVVLDSGNEDFYYAIFKNKIMQEVGFGTINDISTYANKENFKIYYSSLETEKFVDFTDAICVDVNEDTLAKLCFEKCQNQNYTKIEDLSPVYIKFSQAEIGLEKKMKENLSFRDANIGDESALALIDKQCFDGYEKYDEKSFKEELLESSKHYYVALFDHLVIGYVGVQTLGDELNLLKIAVLPQYRKLGVGFKLMAYTFDYKKQNNLSSYFLEVREDNQKAIKLYQKYGFKIKSKREKYYSDGTDALVMFSK